MCAVETVLSSAMQGQRHSYLDLSVQKDLRHAIISNDAVVVFDEGINEIIWANAPGSRLFGGKGVVDLLSTEISESQTIIRQIKNTISKMGEQSSIIRGFRVHQGLRQLVIQFEIKRIKLPDGDFGYKVTNHGSQDHEIDERQLAKNAVNSLEGFADGAAILDDTGKPIASTQSFDVLAPSAQTLTGMVEELKSENDRLIKRPQVAVSGEKVAIGMGRISAKPGRSLIVLARTERLPEETISEETMPENSPEPEYVGPVIAEHSFDANETEETVYQPIPTDKQDFQRDYRDEDLINSIFDDTKFPDIDEPGENKAQEVAIDEDVTSKTDEITEVAQPSPDDDDEAELPFEDTNETASQDKIDAEATREKRFDFEKSDGTVRFAWMIDENNIFKSVSPELEQVVGKNAADILGRQWREVANVFNFDTDREIEKLLNKRDTWSGKTVLWPVQNTDLVLPIDLAALPSFNSDREFSGFRGFGIIRSADAMIDPEATGLALTQRKASPVTNETEVETRVSEERAEKQGSNVVKLVPKDAKKTTRPALSEQENQAFRKIGETLKGSDEGSDESSDKDITNFEGKNPSRTSSEYLSSEKTSKDIKGTVEKSVIERSASERSPIERPDFKSGFSKPDVAQNKTIEAFKPAGLDTSIMETLPVAIVIYNSDEILFTNKSFLDTTGYTTASELEAAGGIEAILNPLSINEDAENCTLKTKSGEEISINPVLHTIPWSGQKALLISFQTGLAEAPAYHEPPALDMTSVSEIQNILDITSDGILILEPSGSIISINSSAEALFNTTFDQTKNTDIKSLFVPESHSGIDEYIENINNPLAGKLFDDGMEVVASETNGGLIPVFLTISKMQSSGKLCAVIRDMTNWKKAREELIQSRHEAELASGQKTDFLANISHEIRTPLNSIIGFSEIMIEERFGPINNDRYREYLHDINRSGNHVLDLINDLLDLSKIEAGKLELEFEAVDLNEMVSETVALLQPQASENRTIIRTSLSRAVPKVVADPRSIRQIILNLVSNAIKFSPTNAQVIVSTVYESNGEVALRIRDTGYGMSKQQIEEALKPFQQVHKNNKGQKDGTGLGLSLTKALVKANRALFDLESEPGKGTIAHVQFPTQRVLAD